MESIATHNRLQLTSSPARSSSIGSEDVFRDGLIDLKQLNYILRNPELPKSRLKINSILKQYNEEKCRAITLSRINYRLNNCQNISNNTTVSNEEPIDVDMELDAMHAYEVKLSQLPQELLVNILGETFTKYEIQMNKRNEQNVNQNQVYVKQEVLSDNESDCDTDLRQLNANNDLQLNELTQQLKKLITDYESVDREENSVSNSLQIVTKELENKLLALRECITLCEMFKEQNQTLTQKQNDLKIKKSELKHEIKQIKDKLIDLNVNQQNHSNTSQLNNCINTTNSEPVRQSIVSPVNITSIQINDNQEINSNDFNSSQITPSSELNNKRKVVSDNVSKESENEFEIIADNQLSAVQMSKSEIISNSVEGVRIKRKKLPKVKNKTEVNRVSNNKSNRKNINQKTNQKSSKTESNVIPIDGNKSSAKETLQSKGLPTNKSLNPRNDWDDYYMNFNQNLTQISAQSSSANTFVSQMYQNSSPTPCHSTTSNRNDSPSAPNSSKRYFGKRDRFETNSFSQRFHVNEYQSNDSEDLIEVTHHLKSVTESFTPHVTSLFVFNNQLFVGLQCGSINKYLIQENAFQFEHQFPNLSSSIDALYYSEKYNYLYCGTKNGIIAYFNENSNEGNFEKVKLYNSITCFESSATILYIGSIDGCVYRFGLMSNMMINKFKCLSESIIGLKLISDLTEQNRIIVCGRHEISIRNSVDGCLLQTLENNGIHTEIMGSNLYSNKIIVYSNIRGQNFHRSYVYDESVRSITNNYHHKSYVTLMTMVDNCFYIFTADKQLYCFDFETFSFQWTTHIRTTKSPISMAVSNKRVILGMPFGKVLLITPDKNSPIVCNCDNCGARFPRMSDIISHFHKEHAIPFCNIHTNYINFFYCPWIGCNMRIQKSDKMIVEHLKSHVN